MYAMCVFVCISLRSQHTHTYFECGRMHSVQQNERKKRQTDTRDYSLVLLLFCLLFLFVYTFFPLLFCYCLPLPMFVGMCLFLLTSTSYKTGGICGTTFVFSLSLYFPLPLFWFVWTLRRIAYPCNLCVLHTRTEHLMCFSWTMSKNE